MKEKNRFEKLIEKTKKKIEKLPEGKFIFIRNGKYSKWYNSINGKHHYISKNDRALAEKLAYKRLLTTQLNEYYRANAFLKLNTYSNVGIIPGINLITTYETQDVPLNSDLINRIIEYYFL